MTQVKFLLMLPTYLHMGEVYFLPEIFLGLGDKPTLLGWKKDHDLG